VVVSLSAQLERPAATRPASRPAPARRTLVIAGPGKPPEPELRARIAAGLMPDVVSAEDAIGAVVVDDRHVAALPGRRGRVLRRLPLIAAQLVEVWQRGREFDAVLTWGDRPAIAIGALMRLRRRRPAHVAILMWPSKRKKAALLRHVLGGIDRFIVWPPLQRRFVQDELGVPAARFIDAHAPVDARFWTPRSGAGDMICSVGQEMRDYGTLVAALRPLEIPCHIAAGTGMFNTRFLDAEWRENVGAQELPGHVSVGRRSHAELRELYARSRFVVVPLRPSDMDNGITVILEAFAMGRAVICTQTDGQTGLLEHDVNCLRVPAGEPGALRAAIAALWRDPARCERLGAAGRASVEARHTLDHWQATLERAVESAVGARAGQEAGAC
jgi:glycosyltransferase involved in cell wall biosynthesis